MFPFYGFFSLPIQLKYTTIRCIFLPESLFPVDSHFRTICTSWDSSYYQLMMTQNIPLQRLLEFKMVAHGYRYNCYYNHCFLLSLLWVQCIWPLSVAIYNIRSIRIWFYWVARNNIDLSSGKVPLVTKSIQYKTMLISIPLICPFYCIGWVQNLETQT
jgi:hypothetical protein